MFDYCFKNDFFNCECVNNDVIISSPVFSNKRFQIIFKSSDEVFEHWNFQKPKFLDGKEVCDKSMLEKMKKSPSVEVFMNELFRIATHWFSENAM